MERLEAELERERELEKETISEIERASDKVSELEAAKMERLEESERMWGKGTEGLVGLEKITEVLATLERARKAAEVVQEM